MNKYELIYIIDTAAEETTRKELIEKFNGIITANGGEVVKVEEDEDTLLEVPLKTGNTQIEKKNARYAYIAGEKGTLNVKLGGAVMGSIEVTYSVNGGEKIAFVTNSEISLSLVAGDKVTFDVIAQGYSTLTAAWEGDAEEEENPEGEGDSEDGTEAAPFTITLPAETVAVKGDGENLLWYSFQTTAAGTLTVTYSNSNSCVRIVNADDARDSDQGHEEQVLTFAVQENSTYKLGLGVWAAEEGVTATLTFAPAAEG